MPGKDKNRVVFVCKSTQMCKFHRNIDKGENINEKCQLKDLPPRVSFLKEAKRSTLGESFGILL
jgi:hypothetical protein